MARVNASYRGLVTWSCIAAAFGPMLLGLACALVGLDIPGDLGELLGVVCLLGFAGMVVTVSLDRLASGRGP